MTKKDLTVAQNHPLFSSKEYVDAAMEASKKELSTISTYNILPMIELTHQSKKPKFTFDTPTGESIEAEKIQVSIVDFSVTKAYYLEDSGGAPECSSIGGVYGTTYGKCKNCSFNKWGSGNGGSGKACKEAVNLMVVVKGYPGVYELKVPPTSLKFWRKYKDALLVKLEAAFRKGTIKFPALVRNVVTEISAKVASKGGKTWSTLDFVEASYLIDSPDKLFLDTVTEAIDLYSNLYEPTPVTSGSSEPIKVGDIEPMTAQSNAAPFNPAEPGSITEAEVVNSKEDSTSMAELFKG